MATPRRGSDGVMSKEIVQKSCRNVAPHLYLHSLPCCHATSRLQTNTKQAICQSTKPSHCKDTVLLFDPSSHLSFPNEKNLESRKVFRDLGRLQVS